MTEAVPDEWRRGLSAWASANANIRELWLFGSRADGSARPNSDVDIGIGLMPPNGKHDWALGTFFALHNEWQRQLEPIVGHHVSLEPITPGKQGTARVRKWVLIWQRDPVSAGEMR